MVKLVEAYVDAGGNHIDTAAAYGLSERIIGEALSKGIQREKLFIASKVGSDGKPDELESVRASLENSLRELKTDYMDMFYLHSPPEDYDGMNRLLELYEKFKEEGKIRFIGASIKGPNVTRDTQQLCNQYIKDGRTDVIQLIYSILRQSNEEIFDLASEKGVGIVARTVLESGMLTGKFHKGMTFDSKDHRSRWGQQKIDWIFEQSEWLKGQIDELSYDNITQLAIRFAIDHPGIQTTIIGAKSLTQLEENCSVEKFQVIPEAFRKVLVNRYYDTGYLSNIC